MSSLSEQAYHSIRRMIIELELEPGAVVRDEVLRQRLGLGRTPIREAIQRLALEQFVTVVPRQGVFVSGVEVAELALLYETRAVLEPYAARLAARRGHQTHWQQMAEVLSRPPSEVDPLGVDRACHELMWQAASNRFLTSTLDVLYAQSDRLWHMYLAHDVDMDQPLQEHVAILEALAAGDADLAAERVESHVRAFDGQIRRAVTASLTL